MVASEMSKGQAFRQPPSAGSDAAAATTGGLFEYFTRPAAGKGDQWARLDSLADLDVEELGLPTDRVLDDGFGASPLITDASHRFRWVLLEATMRQLVMVNLRRELESAGVDVTDLSRGSPGLAHALSCFEERIRRCEATLFSLEVPPQMRKLRDSAEGGGGNTAYPASSLFKIRTLLEPSANPFRGVDARRLWSCLVNREQVQSTIEAIVFLPNRSTSEGTGPIPEEPAAGASDADNPRSAFQTVHRVGGEVTALCANCSREDSLAFSSSKHLFEILLAPAEGAAGTDESPLSRIAAGLTSPQSPMSRQTSGQLLVTPPPSPANGSVDTSFGSPAVSVTRQRPVSGVCRLASHPSTPLYLAGHGDKGVDVYQFEGDQAMYTFQPGGSPGKPSDLSFDPFGHKLAACYLDGTARLWQLEVASQPYASFTCGQRADALAFVKSSVVVLGGKAEGDKNVSVFDTLLPPRSAQVQRFQCMPQGCRAVRYLAERQQLVVGGRGGHIALLDMRQGQVVNQWGLHDAAINCVALHPDPDLVFSACRDGNVKVSSPR